MKPILVFPAPSALEIPKSFFESLPTAGFQKMIFIMTITKKSGRFAPTLLCSELHST
jgi:hypothetical protein